MPRLSLTIVATAGFLLGSKAGPEPARIAADLFRSLRRDPRVREVAQKAADAADDLVLSALHRSPWKAEPAVTPYVT